MATETKKSKARVEGQRSPEEIRPRHRGHPRGPGETVAEIAEKTDVKKQAKRKVDEGKPRRPRRTRSEKAAQKERSAERRAESRRRRRKATQQATSPRSRPPNRP